MKMREIAKKFTGVMPPMVTPFDKDDGINESALRSEIHYLLDAGVSALVAGGSTGEGAALTVQELQELCRITVAEVGSKVPVIGGVIPTSTKDALVRCRAVKKSGVHAVMVTPVTYGITTDDGMYEYYATIGKQIGLPFIIYNVIPQAPVRPDVVERLTVIDEFAGIKESSAGDLLTLTELLSRVGDEISVIAALDRRLFPSLVLGSCGTIAAINTILPKLSVDLFSAIQESDYQRAREINFQIWRVGKELTFNPATKSYLNLENWASKVKELINLQKGRSVGKARHPMVDVKPEERKRFKTALAEIGII